MNTSARKQFLELVQVFRLASEADKEALASDYLTLVQRQSASLKPITPILGFCMERAGSKERAEAIFNHVVENCNITYWPCPEVPAPLRRGHPDLKAACFKHASVPVKLTETLAVLCGTNPYDAEGVRAVFKHVAAKNPFPIFVLSEPEKVLKAVVQIE
jgi:L-amino acid N-acyltransferase YncA